MLPSLPNVGSHSPPPFETRRPCWYLFPSLINLGPPNPPPSRPSILTRTLPRVHPLRGSAFLRAHRPVSGSDTIYNGGSPLLADIVLLRLSFSGFSLRFLKSFREKFSYPFKECFVILPTNVRSHIILD